MDYLEDPILVLLYCRKGRLEIGNFDILYEADWNGIDVPRIICLLNPNNKMWAAVGIALLHTYKYSYGLLPCLNCIVVQDLGV